MRGANALESSYRDWHKWYDYLDGKQWDGRYKNRLTLNFVYPTVFHGMAVMTETIPEPIYVERESEDEGKARLMNYEWNQCSENSRFPLQLGEGAENSIIYGTGFLRARWNPDIMGGYGGVVFESWPGWGVIPDPEGKSVRDCGTVTFKREISRRTLEQEFGKLDDKTWAALAMGLTKSNDEKAPEQYPYQNAMGGREVALQLECFIRNGALDKPAEDVSKQPWGPVPRYIRIVGDCVLHDGPSIYGPYIPLVAVKTDPLPGEFWGRSRIKQIKDVQDMINRRNHAVNASFDFAAFPAFVKDREAEVAPDLKAEPGVIIEKNMGTEVKFIRGPGPSPTEMAAIEQDISMLDRLGMLQAVMQGIRPKGVSSGVALSQLQTAAQASVRLQMRHVADAVKECAEMLPEFLKRFYIKPRPAIVEGIKILIKGKAFEGNWLVRIKTQAMLPTDNLSAFEQMRQLAAMGAISPELLVEKAPFLDDVTKLKVKEHAARQSEAAGLAEASAGGPMEMAPMEAM